MTLQEYSTKIWPFYLRLEKDLLTTLNYVEFSQDNFLTYSVEFEKQLLSICSEVDVLCKLLCKEIDPSRSSSKINEYADILTGINGFTSAKVIFGQDGEKYTPFIGWTTEDSPSWWKAYNKVKHERITSENYKKGNLGNVFMALTGLYSLNRYYCRQISGGRLVNEPSPKSQVFSMEGWRVCIPVGNGFVQVLEEDGSVSMRYDGTM